MQHTLPSMATIAVLLGALSLANAPNRPASVFRILSTHPLCHVCIQKPHVAVSSIATDGLIEYREQSCGGGHPTDEALKHIKRSCLPWI